MRQNLPSPSGRSGFLSSKYWIPLAAVAASLVAYGGMVRLHMQHGTLRAAYTPLTLKWYALAFTAYLGALLWAEWHRGFSRKVLWGGAIAFRILLLCTAPTLSDDVYRYMWDGYVANNGVSPYTYPIDSPELDYLDIPQRTLANNRWMASPYLPAAQLLFAGLTRLFPLYPIFFQGMMVIFDLLGGLILVRLLALAGLPGYRALLYLWHPLVVVEVAHGAHVDAWMIFLMLLALGLTVSPGQPKISAWLAPVTLALATLTKVIPLLLLPVLFWRWRWKQLALYAAVVMVLVVPFGLHDGWGLSGPMDGTGLFGAIRLYADQWNFNSGLFHWLEVDWLPALGIGEANDVAKRIAALVLWVVLSGVWLRARRRTEVRSTLRLMAIPFMAYLLLTTTVHPWYVLVLLVFLPFLPPAPGESGWRWLAVGPWLYLSAALPLSYLTYLNPVDFQELEWVRRMEWLPTLGLAVAWLAWDILHSRRQIVRRA